MGVLLEGVVKCRSERKVPLLYTSVGGDAWFYSFFIFSFEISYTHTNHHPPATGIMLKYLVISQYNFDSCTRSSTSPEIINEAFVLLDDLLYLSFVLR